MTIVYPTVVERVLRPVNITEKNGQLVAIRAVDGEGDLLIITTNGIIIRLPLDQVKMSGRATQGVRLIRVDDDNGSFFN